MNEAIEEPKPDLLVPLDELLELERAGRNDVLGLPIQAWGGAALHYDAPKHPPAVAWNAFPASTSYFAPSTSVFLINYAVDNMDAVLARLAAKGVAILKRDDKDDDNGRFAWILDSEGNKIELWEPRR